MAGSNPFNVITIFLSLNSTNSVKAFRETPLRLLFDTLMNYTDDSDFIFREDQKYVLLDFSDMKYTGLLNMLSMGNLLTTHIYKKCSSCTHVFIIDPI